jgi:hypothetical protein
MTWIFSKMEKVMGAVEQLTIGRFAPKTPGKSPRTK